MSEHNPFTPPRDDDLGAAASAPDDPHARAKAYRLVMRAMLLRTLAWMSWGATTIVMVYIRMALEWRKAGPLPWWLEAFAICLGLSALVAWLIGVPLTAMAVFWASRGLLPMSVRLVLMLLALAPLVCLLPTLVVTWVARRRLLADGWRVEWLGLGRIVPPADWSD